MMNLLIVAETDEAAAALLLFAAKTKGITVETAEDAGPAKRSPKKPAVTAHPEPPSRRRRHSPRKKCRHCGRLFSPQGIPKHEAWCGNQVEKVA